MTSELMGCAQSAAALDTAYRDPADRDSLLRAEEVMKVTGLGRTYLYQLVSLGEFPKPIKLGRASRWRDSEVQRWIATR